MQKRILRNFIFTGKNILSKLVFIIKYNFSTLILFELFHKGLALFFIWPSIRYIFDILIKSLHIVYLNMDNFIKVLTNPMSIVLIILSVIILAFYAFFEFTSVIICFNKSIKYEKIGLFELFKISFENSIKLLYPKNILLFIFVILIIPLVNTVLISGFIGKIQIPEYILDYIKSDIILNIIYMIFLLIIYISVIRWIFSIHEITLNTENFKRARKESVNLIKGKIIRTIIYSLILSLVVAIIGYAIYHSGIIFIGIWTKYCTDMEFLKNVFINRCIAFEEYFRLILSIFIFILDIGFISATYYQYKGVNISKNNIKKEKKSISKIVFNLVLILLISYIESVAFSSHINGMFNTSFSFYTTAIAHRAGAEMAPENTLAAIEEASHAKADYAEIDVQETKDGELIVLHDSNFKRTTGVDKNVWDVNYNEVKTYDAGSFYYYGKGYYDEKFVGEKIPTLKEMIKYSKGKVKLLIEIKLNGHEKGDVVKKVVQLIKENNFENQCIVASMDKTILQKVKKLDENLLTCYFMAIAYGDFSKLNYVDIYGIESTFVNKTVVEKIHKMNKKIFVWTVNSDSLIEKMLDLNVDSIITDNPYLIESAI
ncbi:MAG: glycerophosphoryl diester phosphodiesterase membrane domain-containing protein, partial [Clostridioides difficile]